jgi:hypothetical protein
VIDLLSVAGKRALGDTPLSRASPTHQLGNGRYQTRHFLFEKTPRHFLTVKKRERKFQLGVFPPKVKKNDVTQLNIVGGKKMSSLGVDERVIWHVEAWSSELIRGNGRDRLTTRSQSQINFVIFSTIPHGVAGSDENRL